MITRDGASLHGFLIIDKPAGWTSHDVVAYARRLLRERKIGHAGTLDPAATGVLPLAVGSATKVLEYLFNASKTYIADITFGVDTDSYDGDGTVTTLGDTTDLCESDIEGALIGYRGPLDQVPPMHSAVRIGGRRLYDLARRGETVHRDARRIVVHRLELLIWSPPVATLLVDCSKGTYIRSLAHDLGRATGTGAYLSSLVRTRTGPFRLEEAWSLGELEDEPVRDQWHELALHPDSVLSDFPTLLLDDVSTELWSQGRAVHGGDGDDRPVRVYNGAGDWLGIGSWDAARAAWQPVKVVGGDQ